MKNTFYIVELSNNLEFYPLKKVLELFLTRSKSILIISVCLKSQTEIYTPPKETVLGFKIYSKGAVTVIDKLQKHSLRTKAQLQTVLRVDIKI